MTESDWNSSTDPQAMLSFLRDGGRATDRKLRLFAVACCRRLGPLLQDPRITTALDVAERYADGAATQADLEAALRGAVRAQRAQRRKALLFAYAAVMDACGPGGLGAAEKAAWAEAAAANARATYGERLRRTRPDLYATLAALLRDIFGNHFRTVTADPAWLAWHGGAVVNLATAVYEERALPSGHLDAARLAVLADMLEEAGCSDADLLDHLRSPGPHVRGCFAVDLLSGRS